MKKWIKARLQKWLDIDPAWLSLTEKAEAHANYAATVANQYNARLEYIEKVLGRWLDTPYIFEPGDLTGPVIIRMINDLKMDVEVFKLRVERCLHDQSLTADPLNRLYDPNIAVLRGVPPT